MPRLFLDIGYYLFYNDIHEYFSKKGTVKGLYLPQHRPGRNVGYAFITLDPLSVSHRQLYSRHVIKGYSVTVRSAYFQEHPARSRSLEPTSQKEKRISRTETLLQKRVLTKEPRLIYLVKDLATTPKAKRKHSLSMKW